MSLSSSARRILCMAVSRRTWLGGSLRPLSPTEGKFRVIGNFFLAAAGDAVSVADGTKIDQGGAFQAFATLPVVRRFFSLGRMITITDYTSLQSPALAGRIGRMIDRPKGKADIQ